MDNTFFSCILHSKNAGAGQLHTVTKTETVSVTVSRMRTAASGEKLALRILLAGRHTCVRDTTVMKRCDNTIEQFDAQCGQYRAPTL